MEKNCPICEQTGKTVESVTLTSLVRPEALREFSGTDGFRFCRTDSCDVAYFRREDNVQLTVDQLTVPVFQKSTDPDRLVCYCFEHRVSAIEAEVAETGDSLVPEDVTDKCRQGLDRCEEMNPQGSCCLGNTRAVVRAAQDRVELRRVSTPNEAKRSSTTRSEQGGQKAGLLSAGGALIASALSSACCWLPLVVIAVGGSVAGFGSFFETYRPFFLLGTVGLLGGGFYMVYVRKPKCAPGEKCEVPNLRLQRFNKVTLWIATVFVAAFALFPQYVGALLGGDDDIEIPVVTPVVATRTYEVHGMTCEQCAGTIAAAIEAVDGVARASVSYDSKLATVSFERNVTPDDDASIVTAVEAAGYSAGLP